MSDDIGQLILDEVVESVCYRLQQDGIGITKKEIKIIKIKMLMNLLKIKATLQQEHCLIVLTLVLVF